MKSREQVIALGHQAELFFNTELGQYIEEMARLEVEEASDKLAEVDPFDAKEIQRLQNIIARFVSFKQWMYNAIAEGNAAYHEYLEEED